MQLDEWAGAEAEWLVPLETFMADFRLDDDGTLHSTSLERKRTISSVSIVIPNWRQYWRAKRLYLIPANTRR